MTDELTARLRRLLSVLKECGDQFALNLVDDALAAPEATQDQFLVSNALWGGAGSIADQAGIDGGRVVRRRVEQALIDLGEEQVRSGKLNIRTASWVDVFRVWKRDAV